VAATLVTYAFIHGDWRHHLGNGLFFRVFAPALENALGAMRFADLAILTSAIVAIA
jgi:membrane associated rhomboid family serine protease